MAIVRSLTSSCGEWGTDMSDSGMRSRASLTATLIRCQFVRTGQDDSCSQPPGLNEHSVIPNGPSRAWMISAMLIPLAGPARL